MLSMARGFYSVPANQLYDCILIGICHLHEFVHHSIPGLGRVYASILMYIKMGIQIEDKRTTLPAKCIQIIKTPQYLSLSPSSMLLPLQYHPYGLALWRGLALESTHSAQGSRKAGLRPILVQSGAPT